jgi:hypothetical protein
MANASTRFSALKSPTSGERSVRRPKRPASCSARPLSSASTWSSNTSSPEASRCAARPTAMRRAVAGSRASSSRPKASPALMTLTPGSVLEEQPRLALAVGREARVIVEVVAAQVGEGRDGVTHAVDAPLVERMRGHLHGDRADALARETGEAAVHLDHVGGGEPGSLQAPHRAAAQRADQAGAPAEAVERSGDQVRAGGLAVRAGDARDLHAARRLAEKAVGERTELPAQSRHRERRAARRQWRRVQAVRRLPGDQRRARAGGGRGVAQAVLARAGHGQEQCARRDAAAVEAQVGHRPRRELGRGPRAHQLAERHYRGGSGGGHHGLPIACTSVPTERAPSPSSGGMPRMRSASPTTRENTGAATSPP